MTRTRTQPSGFCFCSNPVQSAGGQRLRACPPRCDKPVSRRRRSPADSRFQNISRASLSFERHGSILEDEAVDFASKQRDRAGEGWGLRNAKLRMSRKLIFASGMLVCFSPKLDSELNDQISTDKDAIKHLQGFNQWREVYFWRHVLIPNDNHCFSLRAPQAIQHPAVANRAYVSRIRVQQIYRPVFRFVAVITERTRDLETPLPIRLVRRSGVRFVRTAP